VATPSSAGTHSADSRLLVRKTSRPPRAQQPRRFREPALRVAPGGGPVLADHQVETPAGQRDPLCIRLDEWEDRSDAALQALGRRQLLGGEVDCHRSGPGPAQPGREVCRSAGYLEHVEVADLAQGAQDPIGDGEEPPHHFRTRPQRLRRGIGEAFVQDPPECAVQCDLGGSLVRHIARVGAATGSVLATASTRRARAHHQRDGV
jgi:hypothetical protein